VKQPAQQQQQQTGRPASVKASSVGSSSGSSKKSSTAAAAALRIKTVFQLDGVAAADAVRVTQQLVPAAVKVFQKFIKVRGVTQVAAAAAATGSFVRSLHQTAAAAKQYKACLQHLSTCYK
jgi:hypothetical protein